MEWRIASDPNGCARRIGDEGYHITRIDSLNTVSNSGLEGRRISVNDVLDQRRVVFLPLLNATG